MDFIQSVQQFPKLGRLLGTWVLAQTNLPEVFGLGQAAQSGVMFQLGFFFFGQPDFQTDFFIDSSILSNFRSVLLSLRISLPPPTTTFNT